MVHASVTGAIDFTACDQTRMWWNGALLKMEHIEQLLGLKVVELSALRASGVQAMVDLGQSAEFRQKYAIDAVDRFRAKAMPWFGEPKSQNTAGDPLDAIAEWYAVFGKDLSG